MRARKFKFLGLIVLFVSSTYYVQGQTPDLEIQYTRSAELVLNEISLKSKTKVEILVETIGEPSKKKEYPSGEISYFYEEIGIVFFTQDGFIRGLGINFNWDGDEKFPEKSFQGTLSLGELEINRDTKSQSIAEIESVEFICPIPMMCGSKDRTAKINCTAAFRENNLTQVVFIIR